MTIEEDRALTVANMSADMAKMHDALMKLELSPEGEVIREDLLGLLEFETKSIHQIDALMIERRKTEKFEPEEKIILQ